MIRLKWAKANPGKFVHVAAKLDHIYACGL